MILHVTTASLRLVVVVSGAHYAVARSDRRAVMGDRLQDMPMLARLSVQCVLLSSSDRRLCCLPRGIFGRQGTAPEHFTHHYGCHLSFIGATCVRSRRAARSRGISLETSERVGL